LLQQMATGHGRKIYVLYVPAAVKFVRLARTFYSATTQAQVV
jgi:hypothetical protein